LFHILSHEEDWREVKGGGQAKRPLGSPLTLHDLDSGRSYLPLLVVAAQVLPKLEATLLAVAFVCFVCGVLRRLPLLNFKTYVPKSLLLFAIVDRHLLQELLVLRYVRVKLPR